ncbi:MAG: hypothetical protein KC422_11795 [Trueperaceae bacterium]|nr:hypothetical protein [Trueperaceae bacterium]
MKVLSLCLLCFSFTLSLAQSPVPLLTNDEVLAKALDLGLEVSYNIGYSETDNLNFYAGAPTYVEDLVKLNPYAYGQLYAQAFKVEEIKLATYLHAVPKAEWPAILAARPLNQTADLIANDVAARYSGYYEVPVYHVQNGCAVEVRFMAARLSNWSAGQLCSGKTMLTALDVQQRTGLTAKPKLVTFEHTDTPWGMMWLIGSVAVHPYNGEIYVVTLRDGTIVNPLTSRIDLEIDESYTIGKYGPNVARKFILPVQLRPLAFVQASN